ncbi:MAG TPA: energy transducer TonB [Flavobacterium sp.]|jgi:protein TonB
MKNLFTLILFVSCLSATSQNIEQQETEAPMQMGGLDVRPEYPGGVNAFLTFIMKNFQVPENTGGGRIIIKFVVEKDGNTTDFKIIREPEPGLGDEAIRVIKKAEKWKPGEQNGKLVRVSYSLPINVPNMKE